MIDSQEVTKVLDKLPRKSELLNHRGLHANNSRQALDYCGPRFAGVFRSKQLSISGAKVNSRRLQAVRRKTIAQHRLQCILLWQSIRKRFPRLPGIPGAIDSQLSFRRAAKLV